MRHFCPDYYPAFKCIADQCRHSCCIGWEIDIDADKLETYLNTPGPIGDRLRAGIEPEGEAPHFRLVGSAERCPMLEENGLCSLICALGEESLCQICRDHPRYRSFFSDRTEIGLGLSCEAAAAIILKQQTPVRILELPADDEPVDPLTEDEEALLRTRQQLFGILQDRSWTVAERVDNLLAWAGIELPDRTVQDWAGIFLRLERLEDSWTEKLHHLQRCDLTTVPAPEGEAWEIAFEQLLVCFLYRHIPGALEDGMLTARIAFAVLAYEMICALCQAHALQTGAVTIDDLCEIVRQYSAEIEYSDDNTYALLDLLDM